jgi:uncharacterized Tic20 family protein
LGEKLLPGICFYILKMKIISLKQLKKQEILFLHLSPLSGVLIPFANILLPYILWNNQRGTGSEAESIAVSLLNFQINMTVLALLLLPLCYYPAGLIAEALVVAVLALFMSRGALLAVEGRSYHYPMLVRVFKPDLGVS